MLGTTTALRNSVCKSGFSTSSNKHKPETLILSELNACSTAILTEASWASRMPVYDKLACPICMDCFRSKTAANELNKQNQVTKLLCLPHPNVRPISTSMQASHRQPMLCNNSTAQSSECLLLTHMPTHQTHLYLKTNNLKSVNLAEVVYPYQTFCSNKPPA